MQDCVTITQPQLFRRFPDNESARRYIEGSRWKGQPMCPCCNKKGNIYPRKGKRLGHYLCKDCRNEFTIRTGTIFERSPVGLHKWLYAIYLTVTVRKGISSLQLSKELGITQKTAWFMQCRIREACGNNCAPLGNAVEANEAHDERKERNRHGKKKGKAIWDAVGKHSVGDMRSAVAGLKP